MNKTIIYTGVVGVQKKNKLIKIKDILNVISQLVEQFLFIQLNSGLRRNAGNSVLFQCREFVGEIVIFVILL